MIKVLVMCQRRKSYVYDIPKGGKIEDSLAVDMTVKNIENYIYDYYGTRKVTIEYLVEYRKNLDEYDADYKFMFDPKSKDTDTRLRSYQFISDHCGCYDMVMLQTCPLILFLQNFRYIPWLMKPDGVMTIKAFTYSGGYDINDSSLCLPVQDEIHRYFYNVEGDVFKIVTKED
jgi:hypothetical protein